MEMLQQENIDISLLIKEILNVQYDINSQRNLVKKILSITVKCELIEALRIFYIVGQNDGKSLPDRHEDSLSKLTIGTILERKISERRMISDDYIIKTAPVIRSIRRSGLSTLKEIANKLSEMGIKTPFGYYRWHPATVGDVERKIARKALELKTLQSRLKQEISIIEG